LEVSKKGESMSVLIPDQKQLYKNECKEEEYYEILNFFACVEVLAWERVNTYFPHDRPQKIFLVTGQTLSPSYAIAHKENTSEKCEIILEASANIPGLVESDVHFLKYIHSAHASMGFDDVKPPSEVEADPDPFSIFLDVWPSFPVQRFKKRAEVRLLEMFRLVFLLIIPLITKVF
jgi:hypothetical protein